MTRHQAIEYDDMLSKKLQDYAVKCGENSDIGKDIVDRFIEFRPEDDLRGMIFLNSNPVSYKPGNARLDLKSAMLAGLEFAASISKPESIYNYVQLLIVSALFIRNATRLELNGIEAYAVYLLHSKGAYESGIEEEQFIPDMQDWYVQQKNTAVERSRVVEAINHLYEMKTVDFDNGNLYLKEIVWGTLE